MCRMAAACLDLGQTERGNKYQLFQQWENCQFSLPCRDLVNRNGVKRLLRHEPVHVDVAELSQLGGELLGQDLMSVRREIPKTVLSVSKWFYKCV